MPVASAPDEADEVIAAIGDALADAELTVDELTDAIRERTGPWAVERTMDAFQDKWPRWRQLTSTAAHRGVLCFGPNKGRNVTYTNPHRWLPGFRPADGPRRRARPLVRRYLHAFGPASPEHFARWLGIPPRAARLAFETLGDVLEAVEVDGERAWVAAGDTDAPSTSARGRPPPPLLRRLRGRRSASGTPVPGRGRETRADRHRARPGNYPVLLVDGVVGGVWHQRRSGRRVVITVEPLVDLTPAQRRELEAEAALVAAVLEGEPELTIGTVTVGAHA